MSFLWFGLVSSLLTCLLSLAGRFGSLVARLVFPLDKG